MSIRFPKHCRTKAQKSEYARRVAMIRWAGVTFQVFLDNMLVNRVDNFVKCGQVLKEDCG